MNLYTAGTLIRMTAEVTDTATGNLVDTAMTCSVLPPNGSPESVAVTRDSLGRYHADYTPSVRGLHRYEFVGTTPAAVVRQGQFLVNLVPF